MLRTFIAVEIDPSHKQKLIHLISTLKRSDADVKWVNETQMHLTLKFLGNIEESKVQEISDALKSIANNTKEFTISLSNLGAFPNAKRPRVIWVGIDKGKNQLKLLASQIETNLEKLGFPKEPRDFKSHLTLGRVKSQKNLQNLTKLLTETTFQPQDEMEPTRPKGQDSSGRNTEQRRSIKINKLILFQSTLTPKGPIYKKITLHSCNAQV